MSLSNLVFAKQRIEQLQRISEQRNLTSAEKNEYETLVQSTLRRR